tara:strand:- start:42 stop:494 length:453 start_codon:yes stop_codon:yes gene_type:complete
MTQDIFFFSNYCNYSKEVFEKLTETKLLEKMISVCVDDDNIQLPPFLDAVPTIYLAEKQQVVKDEDILDYIIKNKPGGNIDDGSMLANVSDGQYSFLDDSMGTLEDNTPGFASVSYDFSVKQMDENSVRKRTMQDIEKERNVGFSDIKRV